MFNNGRLGFIVFLLVTRWRTRHSYWVLENYKSSCVESGKANFTTKSLADCNFLRDCFVLSLCFTAKIAFHD